MTKTFNLKNLCCAHCANIIEKNLKKIDGVEDVSINFIMAKLTITCNEGVLENKKKEITRAVKSVESDCEIIGL